MGKKRKKNLVSNPSVPVFEPLPKGLKLTLCRICGLGLIYIVLIITLCFRFSHMVGE